MQFSTVILAAFFSACAIATPTPGAQSLKRDLHSYAWCADRTFEGINESNPENNDATTAACARYKARNTGTNQWDTCPDCSTSFRGDVNVCNSPDKHIGGDE